MDSDKNVFTKTGALRKADKGAYLIEGKKRVAEAWFNLTFPELTSNGISIPDFGEYTITKDGRVYSKYKHKFLVLSKSKNNKGGKACYNTLKLNRDDGTVKHKYVHRVVAEVYLPNPENLPEVNHIDGDYFNNVVENLEWCTHKQNVEHALASGLMNDRCHKIVTVDILTGVRRAYLSMTQLERARKSDKFLRSGIKRARDAGTVYKGVRIEHYTDTETLPFEPPIVEVL